MMDELDAVFADAKADAMQPSQDLMVRVMADAAALQPQPRPKLAPLRKPAQAAKGFWATLAALFGGAGALAGVGSAAVAGLFIGFVQPSAFDSVTGLLVSTATIDHVELIPDVDALLAGE